MTREGTVVADPRLEREGNKVFDHRLDRGLGCLIRYQGRE